MPIRTKLAAALAVPLAGLLVTTWLEVSAAATDASRVRREVALAEASFGPSSITIALYAERAFASTYAIGMEGSFSLQASSNAEARATTDEAVERFTKDLEERDSGLRSAYAPALDALAGISQARADVDAVDDARRSLAGSAVASAIFDRYTAVTDALAVAQAEVSSSIGDHELRRGAELLELGNRNSDLLARLVRNLLMPAVTGNLRLDEPPELTVVAADLSGLTDISGQIMLRGQGSYEAAVGQLYDTDHIQAFPVFVEDALASGQVDIAAVGPTATGTEPDSFGYVVFRDDISDLLRDTVARARDAADRRVRLYTALALATTVLAAGAAILAARSISKPLLSLARQAHAMAREHLPRAVDQVLSGPLGEDIVVPTLEPIGVKSRDEVADVADALDNVQGAALDLAVEQAVLRRHMADAFVNLGRRNQNLVGRQLDFITGLETDEIDADRLDALFRLDHLATRIRRNAESLLVLAGLETPRTWTEPQSVSHVVRSAVGEVDDFRRAAVGEIAPATVPGGMAVDLAHLLAELVENGLRASTRTGGVDIRGGYQSDGTYLLGVIDDGVGMTRDEINVANRRLAGSESFTVAPSNYLGHYVVGHLAARHGIRARLVQSALGGITALVELPPSLISGVQTAGGPAVGAAVSHRGARLTSSGSTTPGCFARHEM